jgi:MFS family permease
MRMTEDALVGPQDSLASPHLVQVLSKSGTRVVGLGKIAAMISILATVYFLAAAVCAHIVATRYNFLTDYISDYAVGPWGWVYGSAFLASAVGCFALAVAIFLLIPSQALSKLGVVLLALVGITYVIDFIFPTDILPPGAPPTTRIGSIHLLGAFLGWVLFTVGSVLISSRLRYNFFWNTWRPLLTALAWLSVLLLLLLVWVVMSKAPLGGLVEKLFIFDRNLWALTTGVAALKVCGLRSID